MTRSVNKTQIDIMLDRMLSNEVIACGHEKLSRKVIADFWNNLAEDLNKIGPPIKNVTEWKKVWTDQKRYVRTKAELNLKVGQEPGRHVKRLSATEQCIIDLVGMGMKKEMMDKPFAFNLSNPFGNNTNNETNNEETRKFMTFAEIPAGVNSEASNCSNLLTPMVQQDPFTSPETSSFSIVENKVFETETQKSANTNAYKSTNIKTEDNLLATINQMGDCIENYNKKMGIMVREIGDSIEKHNNEMKVMLKRIYRSLEESNDLKAKKLKELERHHREKEYLRHKEVESKIEKNKQFIEIEKIKLLRLKRKK